MNAPRLAERRERIGNELSVRCTTALDAVTKDVLDLVDILLSFCQSDALTAAVRFGEPNPRHPPLDNDEECVLPGGAHPRNVLTATKIGEIENDLK